MGFNKEFITEKLAESNFDIIDMQHDDNDILRITIVHEIHPGIEVIVSVIGDETSEEDSMVLQFDGPDDYTDDEAKQVLQEVMDVLIAVIAAAIEESPTPLEGEGEGEDEDENEEGASEENNENN